MANLYYYLDMRRPSKEGAGTLKIGLNHNRKTVYTTLGFHLKPDQWDTTRSQVTNRPDKKFLNVEIRRKFADVSAALARVEARKDFASLTIREIADMIVRGADTVDTPGDLDYVLPVYNEYITLCRKTSTAQVYKSSLRNLLEYCEDIDTLRFKDINVAWLRKYQAWLLDPKGKGMEVNGANVYLRNLRTIFNYALNNQMTSARYPFKDIDMTTMEPDKRLVPYETFLDWATRPMPDFREFYRDLFMLSFYLCGIRPVDLLHVKKSQVQDGRLVYYPQKLNGRTKMSVKIEPEAWAIINKYPGKEYLIDVMDNRTDYKAFCQHWNKALRAIGEDIIIPKVGRNGTKYTTVKHKGIVPYITVYYARSCWATYAYNVMDIPQETISQALGHKFGLRVTNLYIKKDVAKADKANRQLIDRVTEDMRAFVEKSGTA